MQRLVPESTVLLVVDVQERLAAAMPPTMLERLVHNTRILLEAARLCGVRVVVTEQYPKGLGKTLAALAAPSAIEKLDFSAWDSPAAREAISAHEPKHVIVAGMESHVCVFQTARDLAAAGYRTHVVSDAVASRTEENRLAGLALAEHAGAIPNVTETIVFD